MTLKGLTFSQTLLTLKTRPNFKLEKLVEKTLDSHYCTIKSSDGKEREVTSDKNDFTIDFNLFDNQVLIALAFPLEDGKIMSTLGVISISNSVVRGIGLLFPLVYLGSDGYVVKKQVYSSGSNIEDIEANLTFNDITYSFSCK